MMEEFAHTFRGYTGVTEAICHVRVLFDVDKPTVVIYSQGKDHGLSIQSESERIIENLSLILKAKGIEKREKTFWIEHWTEKGSTTEKTLYLRVNPDASDSTRFSFTSPEALLEVTEYSEEDLTDASAYNRWSVTSPAALSEATGYSEADLTVPDEQVDALDVHQKPESLDLCREEDIERPKRFQAVRRFLARLVSLSLPRLGKFKFFRS